MRFGYFIALWTLLYSHWLILFGSFREVFCFLTYVMVLRLPQFISNTFENDFAAIHHRVSLTNILTESCQRTRRLKTGFLLLLFFISEQIPTPANNKNPNAPPERGVLAARGRPSPRGSAWAWPGQKRLGPARRRGPGPGGSGWARPGEGIAWARPAGPGLSLVVCRHLPGTVAPARPCRAPAAASKRPGLGYSRKPQEPPRGRGAPRRRLSSSPLGAGT